jgi:hypothetical protein
LGKTEPPRDQSAVLRFLDWLAIKATKKRTIDGLLVVCDKRPDKVAEGLKLIRDFDPIRYRRLLGDVKRIWVTALPGALAQFRNSTSTCEIDERFVLNEGTAPEMIASVIVHESTHARLFRMGIGYEEGRRARVEQVCLRRELAFAAKLPDQTKAGGRAEATLNALPDLSDEAFAEREYAGGRDALVYLGLPSAVAEAIVSFGRWLNRRRTGPEEVRQRSAHRETAAEQERSMDDG